MFPLGMLIHAVFSISIFLNFQCLCSSFQRQRFFVAMDAAKAAAEAADAAEPVEPEGESEEAPEAPEDENSKKNLQLK